eukprot:1184380-Prorocentrum_minimum.AAC.2
MLQCSCQTIPPARPRQLHLPRADSVAQVSGFAPRDHLKGASSPTRGGFNSIEAHRCSVDVKGCNVHVKGCSVNVKGSPL